MGRRLRIVFAAPAYWPATAFGGPVPVLRALARELTALSGHRVDVVTTTLTADRRAAGAEQPARTRSTARPFATSARRSASAGSALRSSLARTLGTLPRPNVVHVFGYRDWVSTVTARWCRLNDVPYVFEPLGMFRPKLRKVALKFGP